MRTRILMGGWVKKDVTNCRWRIRLPVDWVGQFGVQVGGGGGEGGGEGGGAATRRSTRRDERATDSPSAATTRWCGSGPPDIAPKHGPRGVPRPAGGLVIGGGG